VLVDSANANIAYAALGDVFSGQTEGVFKSTDGGQTWNPANGAAGASLDLTKAGRIVVAMAPSSTSTLYVSLADVTNGNLLGFYKTTDGGAHWSLLSATPDYCTFQCWYDNVVAVQPTNPNVIYAGGAYTTTLVRSTDGGTSWSTLQSAQNFGFLHADMHALAFSSDGQTLYLGNDGGAYVTTQVTAPQPSFSALNNTLGLIQFYPGIAHHPTNANVLLGGAQDNGSVLYSGMPAWNDVVCGDGGYAAIDFNTPATMYAACQQISVNKSTSSGSFGSWTGASNGISTGDRVDFIPPLVMDPSSPQTLYFGTYRVYRTTNGAASWTAISPDLTGGDSFFGVISTIAVAPSNSNVVYIGALDGSVQVTSNASAGAAATWTNIKTAALPPRVVTNVAADPANSAIAYAAFSGFKNFGDSLGHVFKTTNTGGSWTDISGDLPNTPVNYLLTLANAPSTLFAATDVGVFYTTNGGTHWTPLVNGLPRVAVFGLALQPSSQKLRAATHGRGMWEIDINSVLTPLQLTAAVSRKTHTGFGAFDVNLPLSGNPGIESRSGNHTLVFTFTNNLTSGSASVTGGPGSVSGTPSVSGNTLTVNLTGVTDANVVTVTLHAVTDTTAQVLPDTPVSAGFLLGDVNGDRFTNSADATVARNLSGQNVNATNFRADVNLDGTVNSADATLVRSRSGQGLP
ncbi:MAG: dockerin type I domain-containing protein, partial [Chthoniobacterales bacterium]